MCLCHSRIYLTISKMDQKEFCLKWNSYLDVFHEAFLHILDSEHFTDVTLSCESQSINCHRLVLSSCSSYFATLLLGISHSHPIIILNDVNFHDLKALVKFMYTGELTVPQAQISSLIKVAEILKVKGLTYPDETDNQLRKHSYPSQMTQPAVKGKRVDRTSENSFLAESSSSNLGPPVVDTSNDNLAKYPAETSSFVGETGISQVKDEFGVGICKGRNNNSCQFEDDGQNFDYGSEKGIENWTFERTARKPNTSLYVSDRGTNRRGPSQKYGVFIRRFQSPEVEETLPGFSEDIFGRKYPILSPKHEDVPLVLSSGVSQQPSGSFKLSELESNISEDERAADTSSSNTNAFTEASNSNIGLLSKKYRKNFECNICNKRFPFHSQMERHRRVHTGNKPFKCDLCQKSYSRAFSLHIHQRLHTGEKPFRCDVCQKSFSESGSLVSHRRVHTGEKPFKCNVCQKNFSRSGNLNAHQRLHTGEKPYKCDLCEKKFSLKSNLKCHITTHSREKHASL
ncbi:zinc finger and BTB domain-containing protein 14-like isoform X2 [Artemia franciscana]|uniref:Uncharacterized protein n=1 Tax=Artemia franciscana TaxID=6661 RepID=A0AA88HRU6_ARTSF|nr:hypothetical protein QYM36_013483 [Artemia franciscana]